MDRHKLMLAARNFPGRLYIEHPNIASMMGDFALKQLETFRDKVFSGLQRATAAGIGKTIEAKNVHAKWEDLSRTTVYLCGYQDALDEVRKELEAIEKES